MQQEELQRAVDQIRRRHEAENAIQEQAIPKAQMQVEPTPPEPQVVLIKDILEASSTTEYLLLTLQKSFAFDPQQV